MNNKKYMNCFMGILSCEKYENRRSDQFIDDSIFEYKYFIGNPNQKTSTVNGNIVTLPCDDSYESLPTKIKKMLEWILENKTNIDFIFKTDDDIKFDFEKLSETFEKLMIEKYHYCGNLVVTSKHYSMYHLDKIKSSIDKNMTLLEDSKYCSGGGYFLSTEAAKIIVDKIDLNVSIFEDYLVGKTLTENNITPVHINIHNTSCFW